VQVLLSGEEIDSKADRLVEMANSAGGKDNVTVVLAHIA